MTSNNRRNRRTPDTTTDDTSADTTVATPVDATPTTPVVDTTTDAATQTDTTTPVDYAATFRTTFVSNITDPDADRSNMMDAYRALPGQGAVRANTLNDAMMDAMMAGADRQAIVDMMTYVRNNATVRPTRTVVDPRTIQAIRFAALRHIMDNADVILNIGADDNTAIVTMASDPTFLTDHTATIDRVVARITDSLNRGTGQRGETTRRRSDAANGNAGIGHVTECMDTVDPGTFLSVGDMVKMSSVYYPATGARPSTGAITNACRTLNGTDPATVVTGPNYVGTLSPKIGAIRTADDETADDLA